jgi:hypothetical protein
VAVDAQDRVYVLNRGQSPMSPDHPVIVFERDGTFVRSFGDGLFTFAHGISLDAAGNVYCVDSGDHSGGYARRRPLRLGWLRITLEADASMGCQEAIVEGWASSPAAGGKSEADGFRRRR